MIGKSEGEEKEGEKVGNASYGTNRNGRTLPCMQL